MMIMTIWWSKATRLLEFSRSRPQGKHFAPRHEEEVGPGFFVTEEEDRGGIGYSSKWMSAFLDPALQELLFARGCGISLATVKSRCGEAS